MTRTFAGWLWLIAPLGICRATQIAIHDDILRRPRGRIIARSKARAARKQAAIDARGGAPAEWKLPYAYKAKLVTCPWCASIYIAAATVGALEAGSRVSWLSWLEALTLGILAALSLSLVAAVVDLTIDRVLPETPAPGPAPKERPSPDVAAVLDGLEG